MLKKGTRSTRRKSRLPKLKIKQEICVLEFVRTIVPVLGIALQVVILVHLF